MHTDPIIQEVYRIKDAIAARHNYDMASLFTELRAIEAQHADRMVTSLENLPILDPSLNSLEALEIDWDRLGSDRAGLGRSHRGRSAPGS